MADVKAIVSTHVRQLRRENARLRRELEVKATHIRALETARNIAVRLAVSGGPARRNQS